MRVHLITPSSPAPATPSLALLSLALSLGLAACGPGASGTGSADAGRPVPQPAAKPVAAAAGYLAPPDLGAARRTSAGLVLQGQAPPGATVNLASPEGIRLSTTAAADGRWSLTLPAPAAPAMFALSAVLGQRTLRAEGAVLVLPEPGPPGLLLRAGFAAVPLGAPASPPVVAALDYDRGGGAAVAGLTRPMTRVRLSVDGAAAGLSQADELGRFAVLAANRPLAPGRRRLQIDADPGQTEVEVTVSRPETLGRAVYRAVRQDGAWRIDWSPSGGGVQTTVVFDRAARPPVGGAP
jgi:hypothetical protein